MVLAKITYKTRPLQTMKEGAVSDGFACAVCSVCPCGASKDTLNTQHTRIHDMLPHPSHYVMFMFYM
jgi:hypothetical protein